MPMLRDICLEIWRNLISVEQPLCNVFDCEALTSFFMKGSTKGVIFSSELDAKDHLNLVVSKCDLCTNLCEDY